MPQPNKNQPPKKSSLFQKYGKKLVDSAQKHKDDPVEYGGFRSLPGNIKNGVAQLTECYFDQFKDDSDMKQADGSKAVGQYYLRCAATVLEPDFGPDGSPAKGLVTSVMIPICEKGVKRGKEIIDFDMCIKKVQNQLKALGGDDFDVSDLDVAVEALAATAAPENQHIFFRFTTSEMPARPPEYPNPRVFENWYERIENYEGAAGGDNPAPDANDQSEDGDTGGGNEAADEPSGVDYSAEEDLDVLVAGAGEAGNDNPTDDETAAQERLKQLAEEAGVAEDDVKNADDWQAVANLITSAKEGDTSEPEAAPPKVGEVRHYFPLDSKNKPAKKPIEVKVLTIKGGKATVKDMDKGKPIVGADKKPLQIDLGDLPPVS